MSTEKVKYFNAEEARNKSDMYTKTKVDELIDNIFTYGIIDAVNGGEYSCQVSIDHTKYPLHVRCKAMEELKSLGYNVCFLTRTDVNDSKHESFTDKTKMEVNWSKMTSGEVECLVDDAWSAVVGGDGTPSDELCG